MPLEVTTIWDCGMCNLRSFFFGIFFFFFWLVNDSFHVFLSFIISDIGVLRLGSLRPVKATTTLIDAEYDSSSSSSSF
jgi:hypothetical protein